ncbi:hypothetical protein ES703_83450 [subsurface metagenome]
MAHLVRKKAENEFELRSAASENSFIKSGSEI